MNQDVAFCDDWTTGRAFAGRRVTVVGLGRFGGGLGVTNWLCEQGADVTISDSGTAESLAASIAQLTQPDKVKLHFGEHRRKDFLCTDLLVVNPAFPKEHPLLAEAVAAGIPRTSEMNLFIERCPARMVGITGSVGKSTITAMTGAVLATQYTTHVGGNIGKSLLSELPTIQPDHVVVLELSSFQLEDLPLISRGVGVVLVTNLMPNHLDRHGTMENYAAAKQNLLAGQSADDAVILNHRDQAVAAWASLARGRVDWFNADDETSFELCLPGEHNQSNAQAAWAIGRQFGIAREQAAGALASFTGLPHRLAFVAEKNGVRFYNDSKCTTPAGAMVALEAFPARRAILLAGGYDKGVSFDALGRALARQAKAVIAFGATAERILQSTEAHRSTPALPRVSHAEDIAQAVGRAWQLAEPGDVIALSPACASYDQFTNYEQRGDCFVDLVAKL